MKISHKLVGSFVGVSLLTGVVGAVAIAQSHKIAETLAMAEAKDVAEVMATSIIGTGGFGNPSQNPCLSSTGM